MSEAGGLVGERLRSARKLAGLSQAQVAKMMDLHRPSVSEIEAGRRRVAADELASFAEIYGVSADWLLGTDRSEIALEAIVAARELDKLRPEDLETLIGVISAIRGARQSGE